MYLIVVSIKSKLANIRNIVMKTTKDKNTASVFRNRIARISMQ